MSISILQVKDENGNWIPIPAIKGDKGEAGEVTPASLTEAIPTIIKWVGGSSPFKTLKNNGIPAVRKETGSYVGTGDTTGSLTFDFAPKFIYISGNDDSFGFLAPGSSSVACEGEGESFVRRILTCSVNGTTVTWKCTNTPYEPLLNGVNAYGSGYTYYYIAFA